MELTIPAAPAHLAGLRRAARDALREVPPQVAEELVLALDEAATNAILYGSRGGDPVQVAVWVRGDWVEATVLDDLALPHGQHLPQPLLVGLVAVLVLPVGAHVEDDLVAGLDGLAEVGPHPWSYWRRKVSRTCSRSWQSQGPGVAASHST